MEMTTQQENAILTQVGRGTPMGVLLRRYWWPVGISAHLKDKPTGHAQHRARSGVRGDAVGTRVQGLPEVGQARRVQLP